MAHRMTFPVHHLLNAVSGDWKLIRNNNTNATDCTATKLLRLGGNVPAKQKEHPSGVVPLLELRLHVFHRVVRSTCRNYNKLSSVVYIYVIRTLLLSFSVL